MSSKNRLKDPILRFHRRWTFSGLYSQHFEKIILGVRCANKECNLVDDVVLSLDYFRKHFDQIMFDVKISDHYHEDISNPDPDDDSEHIWELTDIHIAERDQSPESEKLMICIYTLCSNCGRLGDIQKTPQNIIDLVYETYKFFDDKKHRKKRLTQFVAMNNKGSVN